MVYLRKDSCSLKKLDDSFVKTLGLFNSFYAKENVLLLVFKQLWADNGDMLSIQYAGTPSVSTSILMDNQNLSDKLNNKFTSLTRIVKGKFEDDFKHKMINLVLKNIKAAKPKTSLSFANKSSETLHLFVGTWNVAGGGDIPQDIDLYRWLFPEKKNYDIYAIGLQEIVDLNPKNIMLNKNSDEVVFWKKILKHSLLKYGKYELICQYDLVGILVLCFVRKDLASKIRGLNSKILKKGFLGTLGNKGSCVFRFSLFDRTFAFASGHFAAGQNSAQQRIKELSQIVDLPLNCSKTKEMLFKDHDFSFVFGDLNFRLDIDNQTCRHLIKEKKANLMWEYDQFNKAKKQYPFCFDIEEGALDFDPTFKYDMFSLEYDTSKKNRIPGWCDRILWLRAPNCIQEGYDRAEYNCSDHRPVYAIFSIGDAVGNIERTPATVEQKFTRINIDEEPIDLNKEFFSKGEIEDINHNLRSYSEKKTEGLEKKKSEYIGFEEKTCYAVK